VLAVQKAEPCDLSLLRARREGPAGYTATEKRDEFPPPHGADPKAKDHGRSIAGVGVGSVARIAIKSGASARACNHKSIFCKRGSVNVRFAPKTRIKGGTRILHAPLERQRLLPLTAGTLDFRRILYVHQRYGVVRILKIGPPIVRGSSWGSLDVWIIHD